MEKTAEKLKVNESLLKQYCAVLLFGDCWRMAWLCSTNTHSMMMHGISTMWALLTNLDGGCWAFLEV